ncbi:hypothetical protein IWZ00DRAFT_373293 [Phyllosticta capitalensis]|uniref:uncharacterized protein n=1 Tax=Phyllosticta capitalensis TaxID=121624 RepID=UPI00312EAD07
MEKRSSIVLSNPSDWDGWLLEVKTQAFALGVPWMLIDPDEDSLPRGLSQPKRPQDHKSRSKSSCTGKKVDDEMSLEWRIYEGDLGRYEKQQQSLGSLSQYILKHISPHLFSCLAHCTPVPHPCLLLSDLEQRVAPSDSLREAMAEKEIEDLKANHPAYEDTLAWLDRWDLVISQTRRLPTISGMTEAYQTLRTSYPFEFSLAKERYQDTVIVGEGGPVLSSKQFVERWQEQLLKNFRGIWEERLIFKGRNNERRDTSDYESPGRGTPDSENTVSQTNQKAYSNGPPRCLCGNFEYYSRCLYLNKALRPPHWEPDPERQQLVAVSLTDPAVADKVDKSLRRWKKKQATQARLDDDDKSSVSTIKLWPGQL